MYSTIDLIILGILHGKTMSAYDLAHFVEKNQVSRMMKISQPAIYKNCKKLFSEDYLVGEKRRQGENPEKTLFTISPKGKQHFNDLMEHFSSVMPPFYLDFNAFIWNLDKLPPKKALKMLITLQGELEHLKKWITVHEKEALSAPFQIRLIIKQGRMIIFTLAKWAQEAVIDFKKEFKKEVG